MGKCQKRLKSAKTNNYPVGSLKKFPKISKNLAPGETFSLPGAVMDYLNN